MILNTNIYETFVKSSKTVFKICKKNSYSYEELIDCGKGKLFGEGNAKLPLPPMLMFDRITEIRKDTGEFKKGLIKAELDIKDNLGFLIVISRMIQ